MAKINIRQAGGRKTHQVGPTYYVEFLRKAGFPGDEDRVYYEAWRLRSDGDLQRRIISTRPADPESTERTTEHRGSAFSSLGRFKAGSEATVDMLERFLAKRGATVVKTSY